MAPRPGGPQKEPQASVWKATTDKRGKRRPKSVNTDQDKEASTSKHVMLLRKLHEDMHVHPLPLGRVTEKHKKNRQTNKKHKHQQHKANKNAQKQQNTINNKKRLHAVQRSLTSNN
jgi:hypothetical protein